MRAVQLSRLRFHLRAAFPPVKQRFSSRDVQRRRSLDRQTASLDRDDAGLAKEVVDRATGAERGFPATP
jgi:hypothetical protein